MIRAFRLGCAVASSGRRGEIPLAVWVVQMCPLGEGEVFICPSSLVKVAPKVMGQASPPVSVEIRFPQAEGVVVPDFPDRAWVYLRRQHTALPIHCLVP